MPRSETLIEGKTSSLKLDRDAARHLEAVGRRLASKKAWWGADEPSEDRTVIACRETSPGTWDVVVRDAVGLVSIGDLQILVEPKIPRTHLLYLFGKSGAMPRLAEDKGWISTGDDLWELVASWFVRCAEAVLRRDLVRDYLSIVDELDVVRGQVDGIATVRDFYRGRLALHCDYEELGTDTPINRVVRAAGLCIARSPELHWDLRRRSMAVLARMDGVGDLMAHDVAAQTDRRTAHYADALTLARQILQGERRTLEHGTSDAWTFLLRTPDMVESGLREALRERLAAWDVRPGSILLGRTGLTANPDLIFGPHTAVADVKYKLTGKDWRRPDLYQAVAFAAAARTQHSAIVGFTIEDHPPPAIVKFGEIEVRAIDWRSDANGEPEEAADDLAGRVADWLAICVGASELQPVA